MTEIIHFIPGAPSGTGTGEALRSFSAGLAGLGYQQTIVYLRRGSGTVSIPHLRSHAVRGLGPGALASPLIWGDLRGDLAIIHGGWNLFATQAARWCVKEGLPFVVTTHGVYMAPVLKRHRRSKKAWAWALERRTIRNAAAIHTFFPEEYAVAADYFGEAPPGIVAPNAVGVPPVTWTGDRAGPIVWLGRIDIYNKGLDLLVDAIGSMVPRKRPIVKLHGDGPSSQKRKLQDLIQSRSLQPWVQIGDRIEGADKWALLASAGAFVFPSRWEAFGMALAEAAAMGLPCVATPVPLASRLARENAIRMAQPQYRSLAAAILSLQTEDPSAMSVGARQLMVSTFSPITVASSWVRQAQGLGVV